MKKLLHWWQRNFGHVYVAGNDGEWHRMKAWFGKVAFLDPYYGAYPVRCRLAEKGKILIAKGHCLAGKECPFVWDYRPSMKKEN